MWARTVTLAGTATELAWSAGFLDGEGCFGITRAHGKQVFTFEAKQVDVRPLLRLQAAVGGHVSGPHKNNGNGNRADYHVWQTQGRRQSMAVLRAIWPYLSAPKREQASVSIARYRAYRHTRSGMSPSQRTKAGWVTRRANAALAALVVALVCALPAMGRSHVASTTTAVQLHHLRAGIAWHRGRTWHWQDMAHVHRTRTSRAELTTHSVAYTRWIARLWSHRRVHARQRAAAYQHSHTLPYTGDWLTAIGIVQRAFPNSYHWLYWCSRGEGGHGGFVWRGHTAQPDSGPTVTPGGWLQYMQGTWDTDYRAAVAYLATLGIRPPPGLGYYTAEGQAIAGGWAYGHARPAGKWTGGGC